MSSVDDAAGILLSESEGRWWAWYGVSVDGAADLTQLAEHRQLDRAGRLRNALAADRGYIAAQLGGGNPFELRWISQPHRREIRVAVLGRVAAGTRHDAIAAGKAARRRLADLPRHVMGHEIVQQRELAEVLDPLADDLVGAAELRKRWIVERAQRPDAPSPYYISAPWLREAPDAAWGSLVRALAETPSRTVVSIGLDPVAVHQELVQKVSRYAATYRRLSEPGQDHVLGLFRDPTPLTPDPGAITAGRLFEDAAQRYADTVFRFRVSIASDTELSGDLITLAREVMSPAETGDERGYLSASLAGVGLQSVRPLGPDEAAAFRNNFETLGHEQWGQPTVPPEAVGDLADVRPLGHLVDVREATSLFRFPASTDGTLPGFRVVRPRDLVRVDPSHDDGAQVTLGVQEGSGEPVTVALRALTSHALVVGSTGSGKTSSVLNLLQQLWGEHHVPFLVVEPVNSDRDDYRWLLDRPGFESMLVLTVGDESLAPFRLNPFEAPPGVRVGTHIASLVACFDAAFGLIGPLPFLYRKALKIAYTRVGISTDEISGARHQGRWPRLRDLVDVFADLPDIDRYSGEVRSNVSAASRLRTESLLTGSCGRTLDAETSYPMSEVLRRPVVLELAAVGDDDREQALMIALLLNALTEYYKATRTGGGLQHVTVLEEAHRLLRRPKPSSGEGGDQSARAAEQIANTLAENRKYGEGLIIVEQVPSKLIEDAHKNTALKVMHFLPSSDDRESIAATMNLSEDQQTNARALEDMTAYVTHRTMGGRAGLVAVPNVRGDAAARKGLLEDPLPGRSVVRQRFESFVRADPRIWDDLAPYEACAGCRFHCEFRGIGEVVAPSHARDVSVLLDSAAYRREPDLEAELWTSLVARFERAAEGYDGLSPAQVHDLAACIFMHSTFAAWPDQDTRSLVRRYRRVVAEGTPT